MRQIAQAVAGIAAVPVLAPGRAPAAVIWTPRFFSAEQNESLVALGDRIIPGSAAAQCNRLIDLFMTIESEDHRRALVQAIAEFNGKAQSQFQKPFRSLTPAQQDTILTAASTPNPPPDSAFTVIKEWMADSYWSSREGMRQLGWDGRIVWPSYPACPHPEAQY